MRFPSIFLLIFSFIAADLAQGFDLTPKNKFEKDLKKNWARSKVSKTNFGNEAQLLVRYAKVRGNFFEVARMAVLEIPKKDVKLMDPDTAVHGLGFLLGFKKWDKRKVAKGTYRYTGFNYDTNSWMLVAWKETEDRFLYSSAFVEAELQTPVVYEVELLQRRLLAESSRKFSFNDFIDSLKIDFTKSVAEAVPANYYGNEDEFNALVKHLNAPKAEFDKTYEDLNDARSAVSAVQNYATNPGDSFSMSTESIAKMFKDVKLSQVLPTKDVVAAMAGVATIANPYLLGGNILASQLDLLVGWIHELATQKKYNEAQLKASKEAYDSYIKSGQNAAVGYYVKFGLAKLKNSLNKLGFTDENISSGRGITERLDVYERFLDRLRHDGETCAAGRLERVIKDLKPFAAIEEKVFKNHEICQTIKNLGDATEHSLIDKRNARITYQDAKDAIRESIDKDADERAKKIKRTVESTPASAKDGIARAEARLEKHKQQYQMRKLDRLRRCQSEDMMKEGVIRKKTRYECLEEDGKSEIGKMEFQGLVDGINDFEDTVENIERERVMAEGTENYDDTGTDLKRHKTLAKFLLELRIEECSEVGGYCRGLKKEEETKMLARLKKEKISKAEIQKACPGFESK